MTRIRTKGRAGPAWTCALIIGHTLAASAIADDLWISTGVGLSGEGFHTYGGVSYAPFGHLDEDGWRVRALSKAFQFTYDTTTIKGNKAKITARGLGLEGETGWYLRGQNWDVLGLIGIVWRDHDLFPPDPAAILARPKLGASATVETRYDLDERWRAVNA